MGKGKKELLVISYDDGKKRKKMKRDSKDLNVDYFGGDDTEFDDLDSDADESSSSSSSPSSVFLSESVVVPPLAAASLPLLSGAAITRRSSVKVLNQES